MFNVIMDFCYYRYQRLLYFQYSMGHEGSRLLGQLAVGVDSAHTRLTSAAHPGIKAVYLVYVLSHSPLKHYDQSPCASFHFRRSTRIFYA